MVTAGWEPENMFARKFQDIDKGVFANLHSGLSC